MACLEDDVSDSAVRNRTLVCVPIMVRDEASALADCALAAEFGADIVELRIDDVFGGEDAEGAMVARLVERAPLPVIVTCRSQAESGGVGGYDGEDADRIALYERLGTAKHPPAFVDVEFATYGRSANLSHKVHLATGGVFGDTEQRGPGLILSMHDFGGRPLDFSRRIAAMCAVERARVVKVAYRARSIRDTLELMDVVRHSPKPMIALGVGDFGVMSRVLAAKAGAFLTFAALRPSGTTAPGQPTVQELLGLYRFRSIGRSTAVFGVIGSKVARSQSPRIHNAAFAERGRDAVYLPMPVAAGDSGADAYLNLKATLLEFIHHDGLDFGGASVTMPFKEYLVRLAGEQGWEVGAGVAAIGAANTVVVRRGGVGSESAAVSIHNTDAPAIAGLLGRGCGRIAVIGAGGVARAAAVAGVGLGCEVVVYARRREQAEAVARAVDVRAAAIESWVGDQARAETRCDVLINATPVGTPGSAEHAGRMPVPVDAAAANGFVPKVVFDTVYSGPDEAETALVAWAKVRGGMRVITGMQMLEAQAMLQQDLWKA